ncbi:MAG: 50S ribosomal protein L21 [Parcubacteria group bacterium]|nr:50S ribosomal protein L21 [Parcubacteria group bacterium]
MAETKTVKKAVKLAAKKTKAAVSKKTAPATSKLASKLGSGFAIIETGGKQYKVSSGDTLLIEKLSDIHKKGDAIVFDKVLLVSDGKEIKIGTPYLVGETVGAVFEDKVRGKKINVLKFKSKSRWTRRYGHRQTYAKIRVL